MCCSRLVELLLLSARGGAVNVLLEWDFEIGFRGEDDGLVGERELRQYARNLKYCFLMVI